MCHLFARFTWIDTWNRFLVSISTSPSEREADVPAAQEEMNLLVETLLTYNSDPYVSTRIIEPVRALGGDVFGHCIRGTLGLVFQVTRSLEEVAESYARFFETEFRESVINPALTYYGVFINETSELLLASIEAEDFSRFRQSTSPPDICRTIGSCYEIQVLYANPSNHSCGGG